MAVRNFWIEAEIDGRKTKLSGGPRSKDGGFILDIYQCMNGQSVPICAIRGEAKLDSVLTLTLLRPGNAPLLLSIGDR